MRVWMWAAKDEPATPICFGSSGNVKTEILELRIRQRLQTVGPEVMKGIRTWQARQN